MGRKPKFAEETKVEIVERYLKGESTSHLISLFGIHKSTLQVWIKKYEKSGIAGFVSPRRNQSYTREFKEQVIQAYHSGKGSLLDLAEEYGIFSRGTVHSWIKQYNSHEDNLKSYRVRGGIHMTKGRKTTLSERIKIVNYCIENNSDYSKTAEEFQVSYTQVYSWVKKYNDQGISGLKDNRGKGKLLDDMTELERIKAENKLLEAKNKQLQMENDVLKKVKEIERGRS